MSSRIVGILAFITLLHFGARSAAPATVFEVSDLPTPASVPTALEAVVDMAEGCSLLVVFDPSCPACARAARVQAEQVDVPLDLVWLAADEAAKAHYVDRVHAEARIEVAPDAHDALQVRAVPAAFLVSDGTVVSVSTITGSEDLERVAARCAAPVST
jgi:hypothetical protein